MQRRIGSAMAAECAFSSTSDAVSSLTQDAEEKSQSAIQSGSSLSPSPLMPCESLCEANPDSEPAPHAQMIHDDSVVPADVRRGHQARTPPRPRPRLQTHPQGAVPSSHYDRLGKGLAHGRQPILSRSMSCPKSTAQQVAAVTPRSARAGATPPPQRKADRELFERLNQDGGPFCEKRQQMWQMMDQRDASKTPRKKADPELFTRLHNEAVLKQGKMARKAEEHHAKEAANMRKHPDIDKHSRELTEKLDDFATRTATYLQDREHQLELKRQKQGEQELQELTYKPEITARAGHMDRAVDDLHQWEAKRRLRIAEAQFRQMEVDEQECTFKPQLCNGTEKLLRKHAVSSFSDNLQPHERLHANSPRRQASKKT